MKKFEYLRDISCGVYEMNILGKQGWELVNVLEFGGTLYYYFKREIL